MKMKRILLASLLLSVSGWSQGTSYRTAFPDFPPEPYGAAIGGAAVALPGGVSSAFWNPGSVAFMNGKGIMAGGSKFQGWPIYTANFVYAQADQGSGAAAFTMQHMGLKAYDGAAKYQENVIAYTWAKQLGPQVGLGVKAKFLIASSDIENVGAQGMSIDAGILFHRLFGVINLGFTMKDIASAVKWKTGRTDHLPIVFDGGLGTEPIFNRLSIFLSFRGEQGMGMSDINFGTEFWVVQEKLSIRLGINDRLLNNTMSVGGGFGLVIPMDIFSRYFVNYSFEMGQNIVGVQHRFALGLMWE